MGHGFCGFSIFPYEEGERGTSREKTAGFVFCLSRGQVLSGESNLYGLGMHTRSVAEPELCKLSLHTYVHQ